MFRKNIPGPEDICLVELKEFFGVFGCKIADLFSIACGITHLLSLRNGAQQRFFKSSTLNWRAVDQ